jgi:hypothetical protein
MYEAITAIANERVVTADDFEPFVCEWDAPSQFDPPITGFATFDAADFPASEIVGKCLPNSEVIGQFFIRRILDATTVEVGLIYVPYRGTGMLTYVGRHIDADELAIRIEDA